MFKKLFLSPYFTLSTFLVLWLSFMGVVSGCCFGNISEIVKEGGLVEVVAHTGYMLLVALLLVVSNDYTDKVRSWGIFLFLALCAFLREAGIHHHLSKTDTTPFKSRFFLNPNNPTGEKIVFGILLLVVLGAVLYLVYKYAKPLVVSFFKFDTVSWSVAVLCTVGVCSKIIDRFPANYRKANGVALDVDTQAWFLLIEESSEMFLPYIAMIILWQYHVLKKN